MENEDVSEIPQKVKVTMRRQSTERGRAGGVTGEVVLGSAVSHIQRQ